MKKKTLIRSLGQFSSQWTSLTIIIEENQVQKVIAEHLYSGVGMKKKKTIFFLFKFPVSSQFSAVEQS